MDRKIFPSAKASASDLLSPRQYAGPAGYTLAGLHRDFPFGAKKYIHSRPEFDQPNPLALRHDVAHFLVADNASRDQTRDLGKHHSGSFARDGKHVALVFGAGILPAGYQKLTFCVVDVSDLARNGCTVDVDVENIQKDTDTRGSRRCADMHNLAVGG